MIQWLLKARSIREKTGLVPDAYFSGTKIAWLLDELGVRARARRGEICFGTVDSFLAWHLVEGHPHVTDATNAGRTMLFNLRAQDWDDELLETLDVPRAMLPEVVDTAQIVGTLREDLLGARIPVAALAGDQHAALFGQACFAEGMVKNTYGTGCFMLMNAGERFRLSPNGLLTTMAWRIGGRPTYAFEGSVFMGGASANRLLMQFQADLLGVPVQRPAVLETTALGAALLAGYGAGLYGDLEETARGWHVADTFAPQMDAARRSALLSGWRRAVDGALHWAQQDPCVSR